MLTDFANHPWLSLFPRGYRLDGFNTAILTQFESYGRLDEVMTMVDVLLTMMHLGRLVQTTVSTLIQTGLITDPVLNQQLVRLTTTRIVNFQFLW